MKNVKNKLIFVLTSAILAAGLTVSASAQSFTNGTPCSESSADWNTILSNAGGSNCVFGFSSPYSSGSSNVLSGSDAKSLLGDLYSNCPSGQVSDSTKGLAGTQTDVTGTSQTCPNTTGTTGKQSTANVQAAADKSPATVSKQANTVSATETPSSSEKAVTETTTAAQPAVTETAAEPESVDSSVPATATAPTSSSCNVTDNQAASDASTSQSSENTLMQRINSFLKKCGIDLNSMGITLPGCGNTTASVPASSGSDEAVQQSNTADNTGTTTSTGSDANAANQTTSSGSNQSTQTTTSSGQSSSGSSNTQNADNLSFEEQVVALVNEQRAANGLQPLTLSTALSNAARAKSQDMHDNHYFAHESPTYGSPFDMLTSFGISYRSAGENIAMGYATPEAVMTAWMNSSGHRANILNASYTQIGVGYVADGNYWTQEFTG